jgi:hypothetical protein
VNLPLPTRRTFWIVAGSGALLYLITAITNPGIIAADDYGDVISRILPAQAHSVQEIGEKAGFRSPFTPLVHLAIVKAALALGVTHPLMQFRIDLAVVGLFSFFVILWSGWVMFGAYAEPERKPVPRRVRRIAGLLLPGGADADAPDGGSDVGAVPRGVGGDGVPVPADGEAMVAGGVDRQPVGRRAAPPADRGVRARLVVLVLWLKRWTDLAVLAIVGGICIVASGMLDYALIGEWHATLRRYVAINSTYSANWDTSPWYVFTLLFVGLSLPPTFLLRYRGLDWKAQFGPLRAVLLYFAVFLLAHSVISHKEERFMIPVTPLFLMLLTPLLAYLIVHRAQHRWRLWYFAVLNGAPAAAVGDECAAAGDDRAGALRGCAPRDRTITRLGDFTQVPIVFISHRWCCGTRRWWMTARWHATGWWRCWR